MSADRTSSYPLSHFVACRITLGARLGGKACWLAACYGLALAAQVPSIRDLRVDDASARHALVIGNAEYAIAPLRNPANDAVAMEVVLNAFHFQTTRVQNATRRGMELAIDGFVDRLRPGDVALLYFAGHGFQIEGENYLVPVDFAARNEVDAKYDAYPASRAQEKLEHSGVRLTMIILDACRNNPFRVSRSGTSGLAVMNANRGTFVALATGPGKTADENVGGNNGLFTEELVQALSIAGLTLDQVFSRVRERVFERSAHKQIPWTMSSVIGEFRFDLDSQPRPTLSTSKPNGPTLPSTSPHAPSFKPSLNKRVENASAAAAALARGDYARAAEVARWVLDAKPGDPVALSVLASVELNNRQFRTFPAAAGLALDAGATIDLRVTHHHLLSGGHSALLKISTRTIGFDPLGGECTQPAFEVPLSSLVSLKHVSSGQQERYLAVRVRNSQNKVKLLNLADAEVGLDRSGPMPIMRALSPETAVLFLNAVADLLNSVRQGSHR